MELNIEQENRKEKSGNPGIFVLYSILDKIEKTYNIIYLQVVLQIG